MKTLSIALLAGTALSLHATDPRIDILSPHAKLESAEFELIDLDGDGDLDILANAENGAIDWFETLGPSQTSPPKQLHLPLDSFQKAHFIDSNHDGLLEIIGITSIRDLWHSDPLRTGNASGFKKITELDPFLVRFLPLTHGSPISQILLSPEASPNSFTLHEVTDDLTLVPWSSQTFELPANFTDSTNSVHAFDLDGDSDSDLIIVLSSKTIIFERTGERTFSESPVIIEGKFDHLADLDADGDLDPYTGNTHPRRWLRDEENFTFTPTDLPTFPDDITSITQIQQNTGNGVWILSAPYWHPTISKPLTETPLTAKIYQLHLGSDGAWIEDRQFTLPGPTTTEQEFASFTASVGATHLDQDGQLDFITHIIKQGKSPDGNYINQSSIQGFNPAESTSIPILKNQDYSHPSYLRPAIGDFDEDGDTDVIIGPNRHNEHFLLRNDGTGKFTQDPTPLELLPQGLSKTDYYPNFLTPVDFDGDDHLDLSLTITEISSGKVACSILSGRGDGTFVSPPLALESFSSVTNGFCGITEFEDWDLDGDLDAILEGGWRENIEGTISNSLKPLIQNVTISDTLGNPITLAGHAIGDIDGDGAPDYIALAARIIPLEYPLFGLAGPGLHCIINGAYVPCKTQLAVIFNDGSGGIAAISYYEHGLGVTDALGNPVLGPATVQDWNQDGTDELILAELSSDALGNPTVVGTIQIIPSKETPRDLSSGFSLRSFATTGMKRELTDFNADGKPDYASSSGYVTPTPTGPLFSPRYNFIGEYTLLKRVSIYSNWSNPRTGSGFISPVDFTLIPGIPSANYFKSLPSQAVACADFDGDGDLDTLYTNPFAGLYLVRNLLVDERSPITAELMAKGLHGAEATPEADFDGDGLSNAVEYLFGTNPTVNQIEEQADLNPHWALHNGIPELSFLRRRDAEALKLNYALERSLDLKTWKNVPFLISESTIVDDTWEWITTDNLIQGGKYFYRTHPQHKP